MAKPKITSSRTRSSRSTTKPITKGQNPQRANRQKVSTAKTTSAADRKPYQSAAAQNQQRPGGLARSGGRGRVTGTAGRPKPQTPAKVTTGAGKDAMDVARARGKAEVAKAQARRGAKAASQRMAGKLAQAQAARTLGTAGKMGGRAALFYEGIKANNTATGTLSEAKKKYGAKAMPQKQGPAAPATTQASFNKKTFDQAFSSARKTGAKTFTWRGKKYTTEMK